MTSSSPMTQALRARLSSEQRGAIDRICDKFDACWQAGQEPELVSFLASSDSECRELLLRELLYLDLEYRWRRSGHLPTRDQVLKQHANLETEVADVLADPAFAQHLRQVDTEFLPDFVGDYRILQLLATEEDDPVYLAERHDQQFEVRVLRSLADRPYEFRKQVENRLRHLASSVRHDHLVNVRHVGIHREVAFFARDRVRGQLLSTVYAHHPAKVHDAARIVRDCARGLEAAHAKGLSHGNITPDQILLNNNGAARLRMTGMADIESSSARLPAGEDADVDAAQPQELLPRSIADDVRGLGEVLCWLLSAERAADIKQAADSIEMGTIPEAGDWNALPSKLREICETAIRPSEHRHYATLSELADALEPWTKPPAHANRLSFSPAILLSSVGLLIVLAVTGIVGIVGLVLLAATLPYAWPQPTWIERRAAELDIDLSRVSKQDIQVRLEGANSNLLSGLQIDPFMGHPARLLIELDTSLEPFADGLEYRLGDGPWQRYGLTMGFLSSDDLQRGGPIYVQFDSDPAQDTGFVIGPFAYHLDIPAALTESQQRHKRESFEQASNAVWLKKDIYGWRIPIEFALQHSSVVERLNVGTSRDRLDTSIPVQYVGDLPQHDNAWRQAPRIFGQLTFVDGSQSEVREFKE